jgi:hypothetical protein
LFEQPLASQLPLEHFVAHAFISTLCFESHLEIEESEKEKEKEEKVTSEVRASGGISKGLVRLRHEVAGNEEGRVGRGNG